MRILVIGSGGREHALAWKIAQSSKCEALYVAPGNAGTSTIAENIDIKPTDFKGLSAFISEKNVDMVVIGPEDPLVQGLRDFLLAEEGLKDLIIIGPGERGALLEGSKDFSKKFMERNNIPTPKAKSFLNTEIKQAQSYIETCEVPLVLKADGLAAGKGVIICNNHNEAKKNIEEMLSGKFGEASKKVLVEEYINGIELSVFVVTDGKDYKVLPEAKDYKRIGEKDTGLNTGGMGAVSPVVFADKSFMQKVEEQIIKPTLKGLKEENIDYNGFIFFGLMYKGGDSYVIEYNVRMGDPETQSVMMRIKSDVVELFEAAGTGNLAGYKLELDEQTAVTVVAVSGGYPDSYKKGYEIKGLDQIDEAVIFHAGTNNENNKVITSGGRVIAATALGRDISAAKENAYKALEKINWQDIYYRKDIGEDLIFYQDRL
ncbi:MAG: phosphoribosylamine--glycine ligase [Candidatus Cyclobacteriaceae bacterium M2_1C_046]